MGPAAQSTVVASGGRFTLSGCVLPSSPLSLKSHKSVVERGEENSGPAAALMRSEVSEDVYESPTERSHSRVEAEAVHTKRCSPLRCHLMWLRSASN